MVIDLSCSCQRDTPGKRVPQTRNCFHQIDLKTARHLINCQLMWEDQTTVGNATLEQVTWVV